MTLNPENDDIVELDEPADTSEPVTEDAPATESGDLSPADTLDEDADDSAEASDENDPAPDETSADVIYDGERPLVQDLQYQQPRAKAESDTEEPQEEARFSSVAEARAVVEGFLFSSNEPLSVKRLSKLMGNLHPKTVRGLLLELQWEYENRGGALQVIEIAGGYQMATRPFVAPWMFRLHKLKRRSPLSPATLETLAIVAYRQPITKGEIEGIRGVETGAPIRTLQELGLVEASGRREVIGRPQLYVTTEQFLKVFGLKSLADLPSISELKSRFAEEQKLQPKMAKEEEKPVPEIPEEKAEEAGESAGEESSVSDERPQTDQPESPGEQPDEPEMPAPQQPEPEIEHDSHPDPEEEVERPPGSQDPL